MYMVVRPLVQLFVGKQRGLNLFPFLRVRITEDGRKGSCNDRFGRKKTDAFLHLSEKQ
jgi:hypothetical protein